MPDVSVVIATYNANETLGLQLEALARQADPPSFEVIVVDNASDESPDAVVRRWDDRLDVRVLRASEQQGVAYARNVGLAAARSDRVVFCDADDCAGPGFLRAAADALGEAAFVTGAVCTVSAQEFEGGYEAVAARIAECASSRSRERELSPADTKYPVFMGGASAIRREEAMALGGFDQSYVPGAEDNDFGLRVIAAGYPLMQSSGMALAERRRPTLNGVVRRAYAGGRMHMRLCAGHDLWQVSPHLNHPTWWRDFLRLPMAAVSTAVRHNDAEGWHGYAGRAGVRVGQLAGFTSYRVLKRPVVTSLRLGFAEGLRERESAGSSVL